MVLFFNWHNIILLRWPNCFLLNGNRSSNSTTLLCLKIENCEFYKKSLPISHRIKFWTYWLTFKWNFWNRKIDFLKQKTFIIFLLPLQFLLKTLQRHQDLQLSCTITKRNHRLHSLPFVYNLWPLAQQLAATDSFTDLCVSHLHVKREHLKISQYNVNMCSILPFTPWRGG